MNKLKVLMPNEVSQHVYIKKMTPFQHKSNNDKFELARQRMAIGTQLVVYSVGVVLQKTDSGWFEEARYF
jgi:hypothetical protein